MTASSVLISGAGVAGMSLAWYLTRAGYRVTVVERATAIRESGYAVDFRGEALEVLAELDLLEATRSLGTGMRGTTLVDDLGHPIQKLPAETFAGDLEVPKRDFTQLLYRRTLDEVEYVFNDTITALQQRAEDVVVDFERARTRNFDLVFGADGAYSRVRRLAFVPHQQAVRHLGMSGAGFSTDNHLGLDHEGLLQILPGRAIYLFNGQQADRMTVSMSFATASPRLDRMGRAEQEQAVAGAFADNRWEAPRLLAEMRKASDFYFSSTCQVVLERWSQERIALVGDAGYCAAPTAGMGTSQALLGARLLTASLAAADGDHAAAFAAYERKLRPYVEENQETGRAGAEAFGGLTTTDAAAGVE